MKSSIISGLTAVVLFIVILALVGCEKLDRPVADSSTRGRMVHGIWVDSGCEETVFCELHEHKLYCECKEEK